VGDTIATYNNVLGGCREVRDTLLRGAETTIGSKYRLEHRKFQLSIRKKFPT